MTFRDRLLASLRALQPVLAIEGVLVIGSEVPNLLQDEAASTLVVSQGVDIGVPVDRHDDVKRALSEVTGLVPSVEEPSVWVAADVGLLEVNFVGMDPRLTDPAETYILNDPVLPLLVFAHLSLMRPGTTIKVDGVLVPLPRPAGLVLEKLLTDRSGEKGERDLLVVIGALLEASSDDLAELEQLYWQLPEEYRYAVRSNLTILSLLQPHHEMPDPTAHRELVRRLLYRLEAEPADGG